MKKLIDKIKIFFVMSKIYVCEKCGWQTVENKSTDKLKKHCKNCDC